jgi:demethylmenaquinone methyltransferase / 2-methoxy-6-polyprenyl-1,4-benzoquinol methylase
MADSTKPIVGASPQGAQDRRQAAAAVRDMFTSIAPRYDLVNHLLSFNIDRLWWRRAARTFRHILQRPDTRALDICCGTGDMAFALLRVASAGVARDGVARDGVARVSDPCIFGADFSHAMLTRALQKSRGTSLRWLEADALRLPLPDASFDLITSAFGFRNLADYDAGLREILRVLRRGGEVGILDFGEPKGFIGRVYRVYFKRVLPAVGTVISGVKGPYAYLPASVERFPAPEEMLDRMRATGFADVSWTPYTFGIAGLYRGKKN